MCDPTRTLADVNRVYIDRLNVLPVKIFKLNQVIFTKDRVYVSVVGVSNTNGENVVAHLPRLLFVLAVIALML